MSAFDPKRTSVTPLLLQVNLLCFQRTSVVLDLRRMASAPARFHQSYCWLGSRVAAHGAHATAGDADVRSRSQQIAAFHAGLKESGYVEGQNVRVEFRSAEGHFDHYPALAADLLRQGVAVLVA